MASLPKCPSTKPGARCALAAQRAIARKRRRRQLQLPSPGSAATLNMGERRKATLAWSVQDRLRGARTRASTAQPTVSTVTDRIRGPSYPNEVPVACRVGWWVHVPSNDNRCLSLVRLPNCPSAAFYRILTDRQGATFKGPARPSAVASADVPALRQGVAQWDEHPLCLRMFQSAQPGRDRLSLRDTFPQAFASTYDSPGPKELSLRAARLFPAETPQPAVAFSLEKKRGSSPGSV